MLTRRLTSSCLPALNGRASGLLNIRTRGESPTHGRCHGYHIRTSEAFAGALKLAGKATLVASSIGVLVP